MQKSGFAKALCSNARSAKIPSEHDFFAPLIGDWDIWWTDGLQSGTWDIFYGCVGTALRLTAHKEAEEIVLVQNGEGAMRYVFSQMSEASFSWRKELRSDAGLWQVVAQVRARRKA